MTKSLEVFPGDSEEVDVVFFNCLSRKTANKCTWNAFWTKIIRVVESFLRVRQETDSNRLLLVRALDLNNIMHNRKIKCAHLFGKKILFIFVSNNKIVVNVCVSVSTVNFFLNKIVEMLKRLFYCNSSSPVCLLICFFCSHIYCHYFVMAVWGNCLREVFGILYLYRINAVR